ncbi:uncharacterized protein [Clytia hemisphaerica]|eukprot:TCONS_00000246-protein
MEGENSQMDDRSMMFSKDGKSSEMTIPERIVLSAGYDGDDHNEPSRSPFRNGAPNFDDTPIVNPEDVLGGMKTPPSVLTIDHGPNTFGTPNWHTEGDGADDSESDKKNYKYKFNRAPTDDQDDDFSYGSVPAERSVVIAGQEDYLHHHVPFDDPRAMQQWYTSMQRRLTILENEQDYQNRLSNVWKYFLLTLTVVNPFIINYFFFKRR